MRKCWYLALAVVLVIALAGCAAPLEESEEPAEGTEGFVEEEVVAGEELAPAALEIETDGEQAALEAAETEEGRRWASGDIVNGTPVEGDASLVGYSVVLHDGTTMYQVRVLDGEVVGYFGTDTDALIIGAYYGYSPSIQPESDRQQEAFDAALAEVEKVNPRATQGGIEHYVFYFPVNEVGAYPAVAIYADTSTGSTYAMGGPELR